MGKGIDENVKQLRNALSTAEADIQWPSENLRKFWAGVKELNELLRVLTPVPSAERASIRSQLDALCEKARKIRESQDNDSRVKRELVESKIAEAQVRTKGDASDLRKARELLNEALEWMKNGWSGFNWTTQLTSLSPGKMNRKDHDECWIQWREVNDAIRWKYCELGDSNWERFRGEALEASANAETDPKLAKEQVRATQKRMRGVIMSKEQFEDVRRVLDDVWGRATDAAKGHHEEWRERKLGHIAKKRELIEQSEELITRLEAQIEDCRDMEANARTDEHAERVRGWIEEKCDIIESKRRFIEELEQQIRAIEEQLGSSFGK
jgi:uncharacterized coiled-coil DUF342 family protein